MFEPTAPKEVTPFWKKNIQCIRWLDEKWCYYWQSFELTLHSYFKWIFDWILSLQGVVLVRSLWKGAPPPFLKNLVQGKVK